MKSFFLISIAECCTTKMVKSKKIVPVKKRFYQNEAVFAHVPGYKPWPGFVNKIEGNKMQIAFVSQNCEL